jgi:branched-chain amino acid transport system substrate-binding protein
MSAITRRGLISGLAAAPLARPALIRAQTTSKSIRIGLLSDLNGPFHDAGGVGSKVGARLAVEDFGGSVLGRQVEVIQADNQNKPDVASALARQWIDEGVDVLADGAASSCGLAMQEVCYEKERIFLCTGSATSDITGKQCSPYGIQFDFDTYALAHVTGGALAKAGGDSWYFITADYAFGLALERDATAAVLASGGKVLGHARSPIGTSDYSSLLLQAQSSGAKVIGVAIAGIDMQNCVKQAHEFGVTRNGTRIATLLTQASDLVGLGQEVCEGLVFSDTFYWDMTDGTRAFSKRWVAKMGGGIPGIQHAGNYSAAYHWLKAVKAAGTTDADAVMAEMKKVPVNDFYNKEVKVREDGRVLHVNYLWQVKPPSEARYKYDFCKQLAVVQPADAWRPLSEGGCSFVKG